MFYFLYLPYLYHSSYTAISIIKNTSDLDFAAFEAAWSVRAWDKSGKVCTSVLRSRSVSHPRRKEDRMKFSPALRPVTVTIRTILNKESKTVSEGKQERERGGGERED